MKNNQKLFILYSTLIIISQVPHTSYGAAGEKAAEKIYAAAEKLGGSAEKLGESIEKASPLLGSEAAEKLASAMEKFAPVVQVVQVCGVLYVASKVWSSYDYFFPSQEAQKAAEARSLEVNRQLNSLKARLAFEDCLLNNANTDKNSEGLPSACEKTAQAFAVVAGHSEVNNIKQAFKEYFK